MVLGVILLIAIKGMACFWPGDVYLLRYQEPGGAAGVLLGEIHDEERLAGNRAGVADWEVDPDTGLALRYLIKVGDQKSHGLDFRWVSANAIQSIQTPADAVLVRRHRGGNLYGFLHSATADATPIPVLEGAAADESALARLVHRSNEVRQSIQDLESGRVRRISHALEQLRIEQRRLARTGQLSQQAEARGEEERRALWSEHEALQRRIQALAAELSGSALVLVSAQGEESHLPALDVAEVLWPNSMSLGRKLLVHGQRIKAFLSEAPREANTAGGVFPAIFGTVVMVLFMSVLVTPLGVIAAVYLHEYARQNTLIYLVRISVNNLAGVPSIVYGVFGLGFFVYVLGGRIDRLFYQDALPSPTFGTGGLMWASLTLALLTVPVVIVATEEGLSRIPRALREGSYALGATRAETLWRTTLPMASPAIMTGVILAIARAAGEVAPLMLVGVVKMAPALPVDGIAPFLHLERKFMHLGFHIYDVGFQSPNVEAARPLVYATALLLVLIIVVLNLTAIVVRNRLRETHKALEQ